MQKWTVLDMNKQIKASIYSSANILLHKILVSLFDKG
jgi:hypothetical protein